jgi:hypothetical protein
MTAVARSQSHTMLYKIVSAPLQTKWILGNESDHVRERAGNHKDTDKDKGRERHRTKTETEIQQDNTLARVFKYCAAESETRTPLSPLQCLRTPI